MQRLALLAVVLAALAAPASAGTGFTFAFDRPAASPNDRVTVRTAGTLKRVVRIYLVPADVAAEVRSRFDARLSFVGSVTPDRGRLTFSVPPLDEGTYQLASWRRGGELVVQSPRARGILRVAWAGPCPVTLPNGNRPAGQPRSVLWYGNGLLWAGLAADGVYAVPQDRVRADGSIGNKLLWVTTPRWDKPAISGERIDAPAAPLHVISVNLGGFSSAATPSFMSAVSFPSAGCWRLRARVRDVSLTYVVNVLVKP